MKVFLAVDLEGVAGYVKWDQTDRQRERELITADANAAVAGAFEAGAIEVLVTEAHSNMRNILPEQLDERAAFLSGEPKPLNHMAGLDDSFDAVGLVGYHAKAGAPRAVMCHTYSLGIFSLKFNGIEVGEIGADAAIAGSFGVPVVFISADRAGCDEARALLGDIVAVPVKEGVSRFAAKCIPPARARDMIRDGMRDALIGLDRATPFIFEPPIKAEVVFVDPGLADAVANMPGVERVDGRTITFTAPTYRDAFEQFNGLHLLARVGQV